MNAPNAVSNRPLGCVQRVCEPIAVARFRPAQEASNTLPT